MTALGFAAWPLLLSRHTEGLLIAAGVVAAVINVEFIVWAIQTKASWRTIQETALIAACGIGAAFGCLMFVGWFQGSLL